MSDYYLLYSVSNFCLSLFFWKFFWMNFPGDTQFFLEEFAILLMALISFLRIFYFVSSFWLSFKLCFLIFYKRLLLDDDFDSTLIYLMITCSVDTFWFSIPYFLINLLSPITSMLPLPLFYIICFKLFLLIFYFYSLNLSILVTWVWAFWIF